MDFVQKLSDKALELGIEQFHKLRGLLSASFFLWIALFAVRKALLEEDISFGDWLIVICSFNVLLIIFWLLYTYHYPSASKDKIGIVIAVWAENGEDKKLIEQDFILPLKKELGDYHLPCEIIQLKEHHAKLVCTSQDSERVLRKTGSLLCFWGSIKRRGGKVHFQINGKAAYRSIETAHKKISFIDNNLSEILPQQASFSESMQFDGFKFRTEQLLIAINYIAGAAAFLSRDFHGASKLHEAAYQIVAKGQTTSISKDRVARLLAQDYDSLASIDFGKEKVDLVNKTLYYNPKNYGGLLKKAILEFDNGKGDPRLALKTISELKNVAETNGLSHAWMYSETFLYFWMEQFGNALKGCEKLRKKKAYQGEVQTIEQVRKFNENLLVEYKDEKPQLYFWLGFVCLVKEGNVSEGDSYFQKFLDNITPSTEKLKEKAEKYLSRTKEEIGYSQV